MSYNTKVYRAVGGNELVVDGGGKITMKPGSTLDIEGEINQTITFDEEHFAVNVGEVSLAPAVASVIDSAAHGTPVANIPAVDDNLSTSANGTAIAGAVNANAAAINLIIAALEEFGISLAE